MKTTKEIIENITEMNEKGIILASLAPRLKWLEG